MMTTKLQRLGWIFLSAQVTACSGELPENPSEPIAPRTIQSLTVPPPETAKEIYTDALSYTRSGLVDPNASSYLYAPSVMFDETSGRYKLWACGGVSGDYIIYKESAELDGLARASWQYALQPQHDGKFDHSHTCDPSVLRVGDAWYLYYGGLNEAQAAADQTTRIGVARSTDGGRSFTRLGGGNPIVDLARGAFTPGSYGVGQPAVVQAADGWFYMIYTHQDGTALMLRVIRSLDPAFATFVPVKDLNASDIGGWSVDLTFNPSRNEFVVVANNADATHGARAKMVHYDSAFRYLGETTFSANPGYQFGEGLGVLTNSRRELARLFQDGTSVVTFVGATVGKRGGLPDWIVGPTRYAMYKEGSAAVVRNFTAQGWDLGVYNPFGSDGNFYVYRGEGTGFYADQTAWHWGAFATAKVFTGDFDGDGHWDVGLYNPLGTDGNFYIQYGDGSGAFGRQTAWHWGVHPSAQVFTGDFNGDGRWDVGLYDPSSSDGNFYIQYGDGSGAFGHQTTWHWGVFPTGKVFAGDFDGDGRWDVGLYNPLGTDGNFYIQYGDGRGAFGRQTAWHWGVFPSAQVLAGDFNGDGLWDIGLANPLGDSRIFLQRGSGSGAFAGQTVFSWVGTGQFFAGRFKR